MALTKGSISASFTFTATKANAGFKTISLDDKLQFGAAMDVVAMTAVYAGRASVAASGNTTLDLFAAFTDLVGNSVSATKVYGLVLVPTGANAQVKLEPGASNPLTWFLSGTTPAVTFHTGGTFLLYDPTYQTLDSTHRNLKISNPGSGALTLDYAFIVGA